jgi:hypothetical protein
MKDERGQFLPGNPGRPKGSGNRVTTKLRQQVQQLLEDNYEVVLADLKKLDAKSRADLWVRLLEYVVPKLTRTEAVAVEKAKPDLSKLSHQEKKDLVTLLTKAKSAD